MSIQTRLTIYFTGLFGVIVLTLAVGSYILIRHNLFADLGTQLQVAVDATAMSAEHEMNEHETVAGGEADIQTVLDDRPHAALPDTQILVRQGARLAAYRPGGHAMVDLRTIPSERLRTMRLGDLRIASRDLPVLKFNSHYEVFAAAPTTFIALRLRQLALLLLLLVAFGLLLAASAGYYLARKALAPLSNLSTTIDSVTSSDLGGVRVAVGPSDDEVSRIGLRFNSLLDRLQRAFDSQQRFMADASHELRTPVTVALAAAQVTTRDPLRTPGDSDEALLMVERQMLRVRSIVQQLLLLSQADAASLKTNVKELYFDDVVAEASRGAQALARVKQQRLELQTLPEARIHGNADLLGQALMILLDNAVKFTPAGGMIEVGIIRRGADWVCHISDTGAGIPESARPHIFERFYRATGHLQGKDGGGSGLGLAIAKAIVDSHGGSLTLAESRPGFTRFEIGLAAAEDEEGDTPGRVQPNPLAVKI